MRGRRKKQKGFVEQVSDRLWRLARLEASRNWATTRIQTELVETMKQLENSLSEGEDYMASLGNPVPTPTVDPGRTWLTPAGELTPAAKHERALALRAMPAPKQKWFLENGFDAPDGSLDIGAVLSVTAHLEPNQFADSLANGRLWALEK